MKKLKQNYFKGEAPKNKKNDVFWFSVCLALFLIIWVGCLILGGHYG